MDKQRRKVMMNYGEYEEYGGYGPYPYHGGYKRKGRRAAVRRQGRSSIGRSKIRLKKRDSRTSKADIKSSRMMSKQPVVRSHFPETWLFHMELVDKNGEASVSLKALDNFTL